MNTCNNISIEKNNISSEINNNFSILIQPIHTINMTNTEDKEQTNNLLKKLCEKTVPGLLNSIQKNIQKVIYSYHNLDSIINFNKYGDFKVLDIELYEDSDQKEYIDVIVSYKDDNLKDEIYVRWEEEFNNLENLENSDNVKQYDEKEISNQEKQNIIKNIVIKFIKKFMEGRIFTSLNEVYSYLKFNSFNRDNKIIKRKLNIIPMKIHDIIIRQQKTNLLELNDLLDLRLRYNDISELDKYLSKIFKRKRNVIEIHRFRNNFTVYEYNWDEVGSLEVYMHEWIKNYKN
jgi:hypothetical protein